MTITADFDLRKSITSKTGSAQPGCIGDMTTPEGKLDPQYGLTFPLVSGGFAFHSGTFINDAAGSVEIVFRLREKPVDAALLHAWGQYPPLIRLTSDGLEVTHLRPIRVNWQLETEYTLNLDWDHRAGITVSLQPRNGKVQTQRRRVAWQAFRQQHVPFCLGGQVSQPRYRKHQGSFSGWVRSLRMWSEPHELPGPVAVSVSGAQIQMPFPAVPGITAVAYDNPPLNPDTLGLVQLPDRITDLRKTREVVGLDALTAHCRSELEIFTMLTWHLGHLWPHTNYWPWDKDEQRDIFWKRGHEILPKIADGRAGGMCGGYAHMMEEIFWGMGFDARRIQVRGHSSFEAYSNQLGRWIICDASYNEACHLLAGPDGSPVGAREVIHAHARSDYDPTALEGFGACVCDHENLRAPVNPLPHGGYPSRQADHYDSVGLAVDKTRQYGKKQATSRGDHSHAWYFLPCDRPFFSGGSAMGRENILVDDIEVLYPSRNRCAVEAAWSEKGKELTLALKPAGVSFFKCFEVEVDGKTVSLKTDAFRWRLHDGVNELKVRTVNRLGAKGYPWSMSLHKRPA